MQGVSVVINDPNSDQDIVRLERRESALLALSTND